MSEAEALAMSSGFHNTGGRVGYLPFVAANFLVGTGRWRFVAVHCWGYIVGGSSVDD